jgi:outer membrane protein OmpA-like peptidoglycan-associated protein
MMGNQLLGFAFGDKTSAMMSAVAAATGVNSKAASGLTTLAAPMVLTALRNKLGAAPTAASLASMLSSEKALIASAMPASLRTLYGLTGMTANAAPVAAATAAVATAATAAVSAVAAPTPVKIPSAPVAPAAAVTSAAHPVAPVAPVKTTAAASAAVAAPAPVAVQPAPAMPVTAATATAPSVQTSSGHASAPPVMAKPATTAPAAAAAAVTTAEETSAGLGVLPMLAIALPIAVLTGLIWYWAYGLDGGKSAVSAVKSVAPVQVAAPAAPKPAAPVVATVPEVPKVAAPAPAPVAAPAPAPAPAPAASTALVAVPGANGLVKYTLPNGNVIEVSKEGLESKMLAFIGNKDAAIDNKLWFDFDRLSFVTASSDLTPESKAQVNTAVAILKAFPAVSVKLGGYTDNQGDPEANTKLSETRAKRVMDEMVADGIAADRMEAKGYGDQFPIGDNATPEGRAKNRRTSLSIRSK